MRVGRLLAPDLELLLRESPAEVRDVLDEMHPEDVAEIVAEWDDEKASALLIELPPAYAAEVFERLGEGRRIDLTERMGVGSTVRIVGEMSADDRADFFSVLPAKEAAPLLEELERVDPEAAADVKELTRWPEDSAGGLMTTDYWSVRPDQTIGDAIEEVRQHANDADAIDTVFVVGEADRLEGYLTLPDLLLNVPETLVGDVIRSNLVSVQPEEYQEEVARVFGKYDVRHLPVVSASGQFLGIITPDDVFDVLEEEQDEDVQRMGAVAPLDDSYLDASVLELVKKRAPWLMVLFVGGFLTTTAMRNFAGVLDAVAVLAIYVPLLISAGGNSGSQSSTLIIRGLAVGDVKLSDWWRVLAKELAQGLILGSMLALTGVVRVLIAGDRIEMTLIVAATLVVVVTMGSVVGGMMPILLRRLGLDPATSSTPFIASLIDVMGIVIYLSFAQWLLAELIAKAAHAAPGG